MNLGALRALATSLAFDTHGVDATVTPFGSDTAIATRAIWMPQVGTEAVTYTERPYGTDRQRIEPDLAMVVQRVDEMPSLLQRGTVIVAPERGDLTPSTWTVDRTLMTAVDQFRVVVVKG